MIYLSNPLKSIDFKLMFLYIKTRVYKHKPDVPLARDVWDDYEEHG